MPTNFFLGEKVRLSAIDPDKDPALVARWSRDAEFLNLLSWDTARPWTPAGIKKEMQGMLGLNAEGDGQPKAGTFAFHIHTLPAADEAGRLVGFIDLSVPHWNHRDAWIGVAIGERADWSKGYGSDAMRLILRYAFDELNLRRVTLSVFEYNERAIHTYRKLGFVEEGRQREALHRFGKRWGMIVMGILKEEWKSSV